MINLNLKIIKDGFDWATNEQKKDLNPDVHCPTRDIFQTRADHLLTDLKKDILNENLIFLILAILGEVGNNSFDHNLGNWRDVAGVYFAVDFENNIIVLADRGQGVLATIKKIKPETKDDLEALQTAFTAKISARAPEKRGNGLKFVKKIAAENDLPITFYSGLGVCSISKDKMEIKNSGQNIPGTFAIINFKKL